MNPDDAIKVKETLLRDQLNFTDTVVIQLLNGMMNSPMRPSDDDARLNTVMDAYRMANTLWYYRKSFRRNMRQLHGLPAEPSID